MTRLKNIHPGEILKEEFLAELHISAYRLAKDTGIPQTRVSQIIKTTAVLQLILRSGSLYILVIPLNSGWACKMIMTLKKKGYLKKKNWD